MSRYHSYLNSAAKILQEYKGAEPLAAFLKEYFAAEKKIGSKDRKQIAHLCYCYFRTAPPPPKGGIRETLSDLKEKILTGLFLCSNQTNEILSLLKPEWNEKVKLPLPEKLSSINYQVSSLFPWKEELSEGIDHLKFCESFLIQPDLFIRIRPSHRDSVLNKLQIANCKFQIVSENCLAFSNTTKLDDILELNKEAVIQDYSSQRIGEFLKSAILNTQSSISVWDCCAGSGGKSILAKDILGEIELTVSDVRESILINLKKRFQQAGISNYKSFTGDLTTSNVQLPASNYNLIIADVPCSGSGTWARTPEQLAFFKKEEIDRYSSLQKQIITNAAAQLKPGGYFLYITCSVFKKENEGNAEYIQKQFQHDLIKMELLKGYDCKADTMFAALFKKPL